MKCLLGGVGNPKGPLREVHRWFLVSHLSGSNKKSAGRMSPGLWQFGLAVRFRGTGRLENAQLALSTRTNERENPDLDRTSGMYRTTGR
jgi:hypothetical protein